jgi:hypothetical protein
MKNHKKELKTIKSDKNIFSDIKIAMITGINPRTGKIIKGGKGGVCKVFKISRYLLEKIIDFDGKKITCNDLERKKSSM